MKKVLLLFGTLLSASNLLGQNYDSYLQKAYSALEEGKIEIAQSSYNVYKKMTGKNDLDFETLIKDADVNAWKSSCHIIDCGNGKYLVVQKIDSSQVKLSYEEAVNRCKSSRLGGFSDWRLPTYDELSVVLSNIALPLNGFYWTSYQESSENGSKNYGHYVYQDMWKAINVSGEENQIKRRYVQIKKRRQDGGYTRTLGGGLYINGKKISSGIFIDKEAFPKYNYIIVRSFTH